jgi:hypothetical protein
MTAFVTRRPRPDLVVDLPNGLPGLRNRAVPLRVQGEPRVAARRDGQVELEWALVLGAHRFRARTTGTVEAATGAIAGTGRVVDGPLAGAAVRAAGTVDALREHGRVVAAPEPAAEPAPAPRPPAERRRRLVAAWA